MRQSLRIEPRTGIALAFATALISGVSIYLNKLAVQALPNPFLFTTLKNTLVGLVLLLSLALTTRPGSFHLNRRTALALAGLAIFGGSIPFLLFFKGLATASAPSAALIQKSLFLWVALPAAPLLHERPSGWTLAGLAVLAGGLLLSGWPKAWGWGSGESLILTATLLWMVETIIARRILPSIPAGVGATARMAGGAVIMWFYLFANGQVAGALALSPVQWGWLLLTSALLLGYVVTWYSALRRAPAGVVTSILPVGAVITAALALGVEGHWPATQDIMGLTLMIAGIAVILWASARRPNAKLSPA